MYFGVFKKFLIDVAQVGEKRPKILRKKDSLFFKRKEFYLQVEM